MILRYVWRALVVVVAFGVAATVALAVLFALGSMWVGDELRAAASPDDPLFAMAARLRSASCCSPRP